MTTFKIEKVIRSGPLPGGHTVVVDLQINDGQQVSLECNYELLPLLAVAINDAGVVAERVRRALPGEAISTVVPHRAVGVRAGTSVDNKILALTYQTDAGSPLQVAMTPDLARETIERLTGELEALGRQRLIRPS